MTPKQACWRRRVGFPLCAAALALLFAAVWASPARADGWVRYEENASNVTGSGSWTTNVGTLTSGTTGNYLEVACPSETTGIRYYGLRNSSRGEAGVSVDGGAETTVDQYAATSVSNAMLREVTGLSPGAHTMRVRVLGTKNTLSSGTSVTVDGFECYQLTPATTTTSTTSSTTTTTVPTTTTTTTGAVQNVVVTGVDVPGFYLFVAVLSLAAGVKVGGAMAGRS